MLPFTDVFDLFTHKLTCLRARCFAFALVATCSFNRLFLWHCCFLSRKFFASIHLHEIKTQSRLCVPLAHSDVDSFIRLGKTYTDLRAGHRACQYESLGRYKLEL